MLWATSGAPGAYGEVLFSMHMVQHMTLATGVPVFIMWGDKDTVLPFRHLARGAKALDARTHRFPDTGHGPMIERPDEFARLATEFWADVDRA